MQATHTKKIKELPNTNLKPENFTLVLYLTDLRGVVRKAFTQLVFSLKKDKAVMGKNKTKEKSKGA